ncbi:hypothetical protein BJ742DRAFT_20327 [Cladochytrium replicatum]|nr:hypothetical protein BJ742DRAFT_20327 [Cladochytrium replicatum]
MAATVDASHDGDYTPQKNGSRLEHDGSANGDNFTYPVTVTPLSRKPSMVVPANSHEKDFEDMDEAELRQKLREAVVVLAERERDLHIAAEIGQQLVQTNQHLSVEYNTLMRKLQILSPQMQAALSSDNVPLPDLNDEEAVKEVEWLLGALGKERIQKFAGEKEADIGRRSSEAVVPDDTTVESWSHGDDGSRGNLYDKIAVLERTNKDLKEQFEHTLENMRETEQMHARTVAQLKRGNQELQEQLRLTLSDLRDAEQSHARAVAILEGDLDTLRTELGSTAQAAADLEADRRRLIREKMEQAKESRTTEQSEQDNVRQLWARIRSLENENARLLAGKREAERRRDAMRMELEELAQRYEELSRDSAQRSSLEAQVEAQRELIEEMRERMEETVHLYDAAVNELALRGLPIPTSGSPFRVVRNGAPNGYGGSSEMTLVVRQQRGSELARQDWELTAWMERSGTKLWNRDLTGLRNEIDDLNLHRNEAYIKVRDTLDDLLTQFVERLPPGLIKGMTTKVLHTTTPIILGSQIPSGVVIDQVTGAVVSAPPRLTNY